MDTNQLINKLVILCNEESVEVPIINNSDEALFTNKNKVVGPSENIIIKKGLTENRGIKLEYEIKKLLC